MLCDGVDGMSSNLWMLSWACDETFAQQLRENCAVKTKCDIHIFITNRFFVIPQWRFGFAVVTAVAYIACAIDRRETGLICDRIVSVYTIERYRKSVMLTIHFLADWRTSVCSVAVFWMRRSFLPRSLPQFFVHTHTHTQHVLSVTRTADVVHMTMPYNILTSVSYNRTQNSASICTQALECTCMTVIHLHPVV